MSGTLQWLEAGSRQESADHTTQSRSVELGTVCNLKDSHRGLQMGGLRCSSAGAGFLLFGSI